MSTNLSNLSASRPPGVDSDGRTQLSNLYGVFVLSSLMFDGRGANAILELAANSVPSLGECHTDAAYRVVSGSLIDACDPDRRLDGDLDAIVAASLGADHEIVMPDAEWRYAITLRAVKGIAGVLVVSAHRAASSDELFLLKVLAQQTAAAMTSASLIEQERAQRIQLNDLTEERKRTIQRLSHTVAELERQEQIHEALAAVSGSSAGVTRIADALHELTSLTVVVEDVFGNPRAWSGSPRPAKYRPIGGSNREDVLRHAAANGKPERDGDRLFCVLRPNTDVLGVVLLHDTHHRVDRLDTYALEYAATVLALELSHQRELAEIELRLRRDLVEDLLAGTDDESAYSRAEALGHNLRTPHTVTVLHWPQRIDIDLVAKSAGHWATTAGLHPLTARRPTMAVLLADGALQPAALHRAISADVGCDRGSIGIGSQIAVPY